MPKLYKHIFITGNVKTEKYKGASKPSSKPSIPGRDRTAHSQKLLHQFDVIWNQKNQLRTQRAAEQIATKEGTYLSFTSAANHDLITKSLEDLRKGIRLLNIKEVLLDNNQKQIRATVYIPNGKEGHFIRKIQKYQVEETPKGQPKNAPLIINSIEDVGLALLEGLWTSNPQLIPTGNSKWLEAWLNVNTKDHKEQQQIAAFLGTLQDIGIGFKLNSHIIFPERAVMLIHANRSQLIELMLQSDLLAEFRTGQEPAGFWVNENTIGQQRWVDDLLQRVEFKESNIKICLLDTGVNNGHQLLQPLLDNEDTLTVDDIWGTHDHFPQRGGHGTLMAGIAAYGKMEDILISAGNVPITHKLCSVKILPPPANKQTAKELWGDITAQGIARAEIKNPNSVLIHCMAVTSLGKVETKARYSLIVSLDTPVENVELYNNQKYDRSTN